jgi:hypothetical protein
MNYSKVHQNLAQRAGTPDVYDNPEKYLGPNYASVLNFWWYLESLTSEQLLELEVKYSSERMRNNNIYHRLAVYVQRILSLRNFLAVEDASRSHVRKIIGKFPNIPAPVTLELIALQTILDKGEELIFVPMLSF